MARKVVSLDNSLSAERVLDRDLPNWRELTGAPTDYRPYVDVSVPFRKWLGSQPIEYQRDINFAESARPIKDAIFRYLAAAGK